jgi:hypothetical protein
VCEEEREERCTGDRDMVAIQSYDVKQSVVQVTSDFHNVCMGHNENKAIVR